MTCFPVTIGTHQYVDATLRAKVAALQFFLCGTELRKSSRQDDSEPAPFAKSAEDAAPKTILTVDLWGRWRAKTGPAGERRRV